VPQDPQVLGDFSNHFYGRNVPAEVNKIIENENKSLAKEIDDNKNKAIVSQIKEIYNKRYIEYKTEFSKDETSKNPNLKLKCMHALLFGKNEKEILKKCTFAEAYQEVALTEANSWMAKTLAELDTNLTLYQALRDAFGGSGSSDYITDNNLKIT
tara:strand:+ start:2199 stop:2663 length:465 start_codon:yes stop_codon:yes gene_type:complete